MNTNWLRWLQASTISAFNAYPRVIAGLPTIPLFFDTADDPVKRKSPYYLELIITDKVIEKIDKTNWDIRHTIKITIVVLNETSNIYNKATIQGLVAEMFKAYNITKKGNQVGDDNSYVTCMQPDSDIRIFELGITNDKFDFCVMEMDYKGNFEVN